MNRNRIDSVQKTRYHSSLKKGKEICVRQDRNSQSRTFEFRHQHRWDDCHSSTERNRGRNM